jgi:hypothetical protein
MNMNYTQDDVAKAIHQAIQDNHELVVNGRTCKLYTILAATKILNLTPENYEQGVKDLSSYVKKNSKGINPIFKIHNDKVAQEQMLDLEILKVS